MIILSTKEGYEAEESKNGQSLLKATEEDSFRDIKNMSIVLTDFFFYESIYPKVNGDLVNDFCTRVSAQYYLK